MKTWLRKDGSEILISDMTDAHIKNSMRMLKRKSKYYESLEIYLSLKEELILRKNQTVDKFSNKELNSMYKLLNKETQLISRGDIYGDIEYEIAKAKLEGFVLACEILDKIKEEK